MNIRVIEQIYATPLNVAVYNGAYPRTAELCVHCAKSNTAWRATPFFSFVQLEEALSRDRKLQRRGRTWTTDFDIIVTHLHTEPIDGVEDRRRPFSLKSKVGSQCMVAVTYDKLSVYEGEDSEWLDQGIFDVLLPILFTCPDLLQYLASGIVKHWSAGHGKIHPAYRTACLCEGENYLEARNWYEKAAVAENVSAMIRLGSLYADPPEESGIEQDPGKADFWFQRAVATGGSEAMNEIGRRYALGWGGTQDIERARRWHERAAGLTSKPLDVAG